MKRYRLISLIFVCCFVSVFASCNNKLNYSQCSVKVKISCSEVVENIGDSNFGISEDKIDIVPENGVILECNAFCKNGDDVLSIFLSELKKHKIHFDVDNGYFKAIANIYEGDCGDFSGWMLFLNDELAANGASDTVVKDGDSIEFKYIVDYNTLFE